MLFKLKRIPRQLTNLFLFVLICSIFPVSFASGAGRQMNMAVGTLGGTMARMGAGVAEIFSRESKLGQITVVPGGGAANPERVATGGTEFSVTYSNFAQLAFKGKKPFKEEFKNLRGIIAFELSFYHQFVGREFYESGIRTWDDVIASKKPLRMGVINRGTSSDFINRTIVGLYGLSYDDLNKRGFTLTMTGTGATAQAYQNGQIDMWFNNTGPPNASGVQACIARPTVFMHMPEPLVEKMMDQGFSRSYLKPNTYKGQTERISSVGATYCILTTDKMDPQIVYDLLSIVHSNIKFLSGVHKSFKTLDPKTSWEGTGVPLHEGAKKYYREKGVSLN